MMIKGINISRTILLYCVIIFSGQIFAQDAGLVKGIKTVVIDAGHGGKDPGCHGASSNEKTVTLAIALHLGEFIKDKYPEINVVYTRDSDVFVELDERAKIANDAKADLFICVHANAGPSKAYGAETYVLGLHRTEAQRKIAERENSAIEFEEGGGAKYEKLSADAIIARQLQLSVFLDHSINFATKIQDELVSLGRSNRGVRQAGFLVLYKTTMPSVLIETGFLTNPAEEKFLADPASQKNMATSLFKAFENYKAEYEGADLSVNSTINGVDKAKFGLDEKTITKDDIVYRVQIETSATPLDLSNSRFQNMPVWTYESGGLYKYTVGLFKKNVPANDLKKEMRKKGFEHAFVVSFQGDIRIKLAEAIKITEK
jgi:N-acetylmuramoyl-L-alanine amidase